MYDLSSRLNRVQRIQQEKMLHVLLRHKLTKRSIRERYALGKQSRKIQTASVTNPIGMRTSSKILSDLIDSDRSRTPSIGSQLYSIISAAGQIQLYGSRGQVIQFARHQVTRAKLVRRPGHTTDHTYQILKFLDCAGLPSGTPNNCRGLKTREAMCRNTSLVSPLR